MGGVGVGARGNRSSLLSYLVVLPAVFVSTALQTGDLVGDTVHDKSKLGHTADAAGSQLLA